MISTGEANKTPEIEIEARLNPEECKAVEIKSRWSWFGFALVTARSSTGNDEKRRLSPSFGIMSNTQG